MRIRPWVIGATFIGFGVASHAARKVEPLPDRIAMGQFACFEFLLYAAGLVVLLVSLVATPMGRGRRVVLLVVWMLSGLAALVAVLDSLPP